MDLSISLLKFYQLLCYMNISETFKNILLENCYFVSLYNDLLSP